MLLYKAKKKGDIMNMTLLPKEFAFGKNQLEIFKKTVLGASITDYALLCGGKYDWMVKSKIDVIDKIFDRVNLSVDVVNARGEWETRNRYNTRNVGIRPIVYYKDIESEIIKKHINATGILEIEYGMYPTYVVSDELAKKLDKLYHEEKLTYSTQYTTTVDSPDGIFQERKWNNSFLFNGEKYVHCQADVDEDINIILSDGSLIINEKFYWVRVEPIEWLVDTKTGIAISKYIISSGEEPRFIDYLLKKYLQNEIRMFDYNQKYNKIIEQKKIDIISNQKTNEISKIIDEITKYQKYYHGKIDIDTKVNSLITKYNNKINNVLTNKSILTLENNDKESLYLKLISDLNEILDGLKLNYENNKVYHDILELLDNCLLIIENKDNEPKTELEKDLKTITNIIIPYLNDDCHLSRLKEIFISEKINITMSLENMANLSSKISGEYKNVSDFELMIRVKLQTFLISIYKNIIDRDIFNEIIKNYKDIASNNYKESNYSIVKVYLNTLNELSKYIKKNGNKHDINELNTILNNINTENDLNTTINNLIKVLKSLYMIKFKIDERLNKAKLIEEYTISIPKVKTRSI